MIERQSATLARLVDDLLDTARISRGQLQLVREPIALQTTLQRAIDTARLALDGRRHRLAVEMPAEPLTVVGDATRLEQVFANLLLNAVKYTPDEGQIRIAVSAQGGVGGREAVVCVRDSGIGIAAQMLPKVFDLFAQADRSATQSQGGLGIGLSLVRSLIELHGGRVTASSPGEGKGSEFAVYLPLKGG